MAFLGWYVNVTKPEVLQQSHCATVGGLTNLISSYCFAIIRAMVSMCVAPNELGKVNAMFGSVGTLFTILVTQVYASVWGVSSGLIFWITFTVPLFAR